MKKVYESAITCKVIVIGQSGVGKTSIITNYVKHTFQSDCLPTQGASFSSRIQIFEQEDKVIKFDIWDTAGQERYRSLAKIYYQACNVAILVYDITRKSSFDDMKMLWYPLLRENVIDNKLAIARNKCDMKEFEEVEEEKVRGFAKEIGAIFEYTSAKNSNGIEDLFESIGFAILNLAKNNKDSEIEHEGENIVEKSIMIDKTKHSSFRKKKENCCK